MGFTIGYKRLFSVKILHGYFLNQGEKAYDALNSTERILADKSYRVSDFLQIIPSTDTLEIMKGRSMVFRQDNSGFFVGIRIDQQEFEAGKIIPFLPLNEEVKLRFYVKLSDPNFFNYTSLPLQRKPNNIYLFHNELNNAPTGEPHLSSPLQAYDSSQSYVAGSLIVDNASNPTQLFEAIRDTNGGPFQAADWQEQVLGDLYQNPPENYVKGDVVRQGNSLFEALTDPTVAPPDPAQWAEKPISHQYVGDGDLTTLVPSVFSIGISGGTSYAKIQVYRPGEATPIHISDPVQGGIIHAVSADLRSLRSGMYHLEVVNATGSVLNSSISGLVYLDQELYQTGAWGVIEVVHKPGIDLGEYQLISLTDDQLLSPEYFLKLKNRSTWWRYIFNDEQNVADADLGEFERDGDPAEKKQFKTLTTMPLTQSVKLLKKFNTDILLPNPQVNLVKPDTGDGQIYSEIYIHS